MFRSVYCLVVLYDISVFTLATKGVSQMKWQAYSKAVWCIPIVRSEPDGIWPSSRGSIIGSLWDFFQFEQVQPVLPDSVFECLNPSMSSAHTLIKLHILISQPTKMLRELKKSSSWISENVKNNREMTQLQTTNHPKHRKMEAINNTIKVKRPVLSSSARWLHH